MPRPLPPAAKVRDTIEAFCRDRGPGKTFCPTEIARAVTPDSGDAPADAWRKALPAVRRVAFEMAREGTIAVYRKGKPVSPDGVKGVIRLGLPPASDGSGDTTPESGAPENGAPENGVPETGGTVD